MTEDQARQAMLNLVDTYLASDPDKNNLIDVINNRSRPGLPIRGVLESMRKYRAIEYSESDKELIEDLLYMYG
jgi:hypothetical protein